MPYTMADSARVPLNALLGLVGWAKTLLGKVGAIAPAQQGQSLLGVWVEAGMALFGIGIECPECVRLVVELAGHPPSA